MGGVYLKGCAAMDSRWNDRTCKVYCKAWDAYESCACGYDAAEEVFEHALQHRFITQSEYDYLINLFYDTARF